MIFPKAHTACSQTFWWGECSSLRKSGTASEKYKQKSMQLLKNSSLKRQNSWHTWSLNTFSDCMRNSSLCWVLVRINFPDDTEISHCVFFLSYFQTPFSIFWQSLWKYTYCNSSCFCEGSHLGWIWISHL